RQAGEWKDGETLFLRCSVWRETAENVAESLTKGTRVIVTGRLTQRSYETRKGEKRTVVELQVDEVGPSLARATARVTRTPPQRRRLHVTAPAPGRTDRRPLGHPPAHRRAPLLTGDAMANKSK